MKFFIGHKKLFSFFAFLLFFSTIFPNVSYAAKTKPSVFARSALVVDYYTGDILYSKNRNRRVLPASTVKLLTAMVVIDHLNFNKKVSVSRKAALAPKSKAFLRQGETYTVRDLLKGLVISSANDAAVVLAEAVSGTEWAFSRLMTQKAKSLGCRNSNFTNASGLPDDNMYTTAVDMSHILRAAYQYPFIRECLKTKYASMVRPSGKKIKLKNHNKLLWNYGIGVYGKTGYTRKAGKCFMSISSYNGKKVMVLVFKSSDWKTDVRRLSEYALNYKLSSSKNKSKIHINKKFLDSKDVRNVQKALKRAGFNPGSIDGIFGSRTLRAIIQFQKFYGLSPDGIVGPQTKGKLRKFMN